MSRSGHVRAAAAVAAGALAGSLLVGAPASALVSPTVSIAGSQFTPAKLTVAMGTTVTWTNNDPMPHTATSDDGFFDTGAIGASGGTDTVDFASTGRFRYHCSFHATMHGQVVVPLVVVSGSAAGGWKLRWATGAAPEGIAYDVQFRRDGATQWRNLRKDTTHAAGRLDPSAVGDYDVRARTSNTADDDESGWSPTVTLTIS